MQDIAPLTVEDFEQDSILVISKVEIDSDGEGDFQELPDIKTYSINTNEENRVAKFCSYSFNITCLNTNNRYDPVNLGSSYYGWLSQGRKIKLYAGIRKNETNYPYQLILGRVDDFKLGKRAGQDICTITGRCLMRMVLDFKLYSPNTYWGTNITYNTIANKIRYDMEADCKGVYRVFLDSTSPYDGSNLEEIYENTDWSYDWHNNQLVFTPRRIPDFAGTNNLKIYYFQTQSIENVVADILLAAGIFANETERNTWLASGYCTATGKTIDRVWFAAGTSSLKAITLLSEVVQYRFYFDYAGNPIFKPKPSVGSPVSTISDYETKIEDVEENIDETYTHIIVIGEERDRIIGEDEIAPDVPVGLALSTGLGSATQASLSWITAEWEANTESDFGHYELRIKKVGDADFTEVSTIDISFIWYGLEPGVEYGVQIRAVDIYNNRSNWSTEVTKVTATDSTTPAQITGATATALLCGIKIVWNIATEDNIAGYVVERQESDNGTTWTGEWTERVRTDATMWLDLLLTYTKYYRYRIKAFTQTGIEGATSTPTADSIAPNKAGTNDIVAYAITADLIAANSIYTNALQAGAITADKIGASEVLISKLGSDALARMFQSGDYKTNIEAWAKSGAITYIDGGKIYAGSITLTGLGTTIIEGGYIKTSLLTADNIKAGTISGINFNIGYSGQGNILFVQSGIRLYDAGSNILNFYKSGLALLSMYFSNGVRLYSDGDFVSFNPGSYIFACKSTGTFNFPDVASAPAASAGEMAYNPDGGNNPRFVGYIGAPDNAWGHWWLDAGW